MALHLLDLNGDISSNGLSKLFLTIAAAFAEAERDRIRERIGRIKADHRARGRYLGGIVPFGFRCGESGDLGRTRATFTHGKSLRGLLAQPSRRQCLLRCGVSVRSLEPLGAVRRLAPLDRVRRTDCDLEPRRGARPLRMA